MAGIVTNTPLWVWALLAFLTWRGVLAMKPGEAAPLRLAIFPIVFTVWGLYGLARVHGFGPASLGPWILAIALGAVVGWLLLRHRPLEFDRARGIIRHPADYTVLPLVLLTFGLKYAFGVTAALSPDLLLQPGFRLADLGGSGFFTGIFVGKFANVMSRYLKA